MSAPQPEPQKAETKPPGKVGKVEIGEAGKTGVATTLGLIAVQVANEVSGPLASELNEHPLMSRVGVIVALRLSFALAEDRGSVMAGAKLFFAWVRVQYRNWRKGRK